MSKYLEVDAAETEDMLATIKLYSIQEAGEALQKDGLVYTAVEDISDFYTEREIMQKAVAADTIVALK